MKKIKELLEMLKTGDEIRERIPDMDTAGRHQPSRLRKTIDLMRRARSRDVRVDAIKARQYGLEMGPTANHLRTVAKLGRIYSILGRVDPHTTNKSRVIARTKFVGNRHLGKI